MFEISVIMDFSAAHNLRQYHGKCENLHGHNWKVEVILASSKLDRAGMVMDFSQLKKIVNEILGDFDHKHLNDLDYFKEKNPSSENIAQYIYLKVKEKIKAKECQPEEVNVWETESSCAMYRE